MAADRKRARDRWGAILGAVLALGVVVAVSVSPVSGAGSPPAATTPTSALGPVGVAKIGPIGLTASGLRAYVATSLRQPVYWAGPIDGDVYELTRTSNGDAYLRYLPPGVSIGDPRPAFLIIATYPFPNALARLKAVAGGRGRTLPDGAFELPDPTYPRSVHIAFPGVPLEVEVYDPSPAVAERIARSGSVALVR
jgi:hypothetical protein